jgi:hypothetical protein
VETVLVPTEVATFSTSVLEVQMVLPIMNCVPGGSAVTAPVEKIWVVLPAVPALVTVPSSVPWLTAEIPYSGERTLVSFTGLLFGGIGGGGDVRLSHVHGVPPVVVKNNRVREIRHRGKQPGRGVRQVHPVGGTRGKVSHDVSLKRESLLLDDGDNRGVPDGNA